MSAKRRFVTQDEIEIISRYYAHLDTAEIADMMGTNRRRVSHVAEKLGLKKSPEFLKMLAQKNRDRLACFGVASRIQTGTIPWNKGQPFDAGGRSSKTRFLPGRKPHNWRPIGTERVSNSGYLLRKVSDTGNSKIDYRFLHHLVWIESGREIPPVHKLIFRDGDHRNFALDNLECITMQELLNRNSIRRHGPEIAYLSTLRGALNRAINRRIKLA